MEKKELILNKITQIFRENLDEPGLVLNYSSSADDVAKWDSINNLVLLTEIESFFEITFPIDIILNARNVGDLCDYVAEYSTKADII
jgi:acyl carrier protein